MNILADIETNRTLNCSSMVDRIKEISKENWHWFEVVMMLVWFAPQIWVAYTYIVGEFNQTYLFSALIALSVILLVVLRDNKIQREQIEALSIKIDQVTNKLHNVL